MRPIRRVALVVAAVIGLASVATACGDDPAPFAGARRSPAPALEATLPTVDGDPFGFRAGDDEVLLVYFGFTFCPDVCPTTMADVGMVMNELGAEADRVELAMVTVDPGRDDPESLAAYVDSFVPGAVALRTENDDELRAAAAEFGVYYEVTTLDDGTIDVAHTGSLFAVDDQGRLAASWAFGTPSTDLLNDLQILLDET